MPVTTTVYVPFGSPLMSIALLVQAPPLCTVALPLAIAVALPCALISTLTVWPSKRLEVPLICNATALLLSTLPTGVIAKVGVIGIALEESSSPILPIKSLYLLTNRPTLSSGILGTSALPVQIFLFAVATSEVTSLFPSFAVASCTSLSNSSVMFTDCPIA